VSDPSIIAVGAPPTFRFQVARALQIDPDGVEWVPTVAAAEGFLVEGGHPEVLVLSPAIKEPDAFGLAEFVERSSPTTSVVMVRDGAMNGLLPKAMRAGIRDVIDLSQGGEELREALRRAVVWSGNLRSARGDTVAEAHRLPGTIVSVFSSKGGTGKTFLSSNLAVAIAQELTLDTALVDLEFGVGDVFSYFGKEADRPLQDIIALSEQADRDAIQGLGTKLHEHLWGYAPPANPASDTISSESMGKILRALRRTFDFTVIDATAGYSDPVLATFDLSDTICLIAGLDVVSLRHLSLALETLLSLGFPRDRFRIVLNRADSKVGLTPQDVERVMKVKVDAMIPSSRLVPTSLNKGAPVVLDQPRSEVSKALVAFARTLVPATAPVAKRGGLFRR
jgi:pilus assembly protein CpaE